METECYVLSRNDFNSLIDLSVRQLLMDRIKLQDVNIGLADLIIIR